MMSSHDIHSSTNELPIICPRCKTEIKLTEFLASPFIEASRKRYEQKLPRMSSMSRIAKPRLASNGQINRLDIPFLKAPKSDSEWVA